MDIGTIVVLALRLLIPIAILRWQFWGLIGALIADAIDVTLLTLLGGKFSPYPPIDKLLDTYYLAFAFVASRAWKGMLERRTSATLFGLRAIGVLLFETTGFRWFLMLFPNVFEWFFILTAARDKWFPHFRYTWRRLTIILAVLTAGKLYNEYLLHVGKYCDTALRKMPWYCNPLGITQDLKGRLLRFFP